MSLINSKLTAYVGTYTNGESKGIYSFTLDIQTESIENVKLVAELENPTYLTLSKDNKYLYSVIKVGENGGVAALSINNSSGNLELINYQVSKGNPPCHVSLDSKTKYLFSANYHKGIIEAFPIGMDGNINTASSIVAHEGSGANIKRQDKPHAHYASLTPDEKYLCAVDLGIDKLVIYDFEDGILSRSEKLSLSLNPGCGPRHMDFHHTGKFAYILTELSSEIIALEYNPLNSGFKELQRISTLPKDYAGENLGSAIHVSPDGNFLYASNRGHDSIAVFRINNSSGKLELISYTSTGGIHPRDFEIDPTGNFIIAANQNSNNIVPFKIDRATGKLTQVSAEVSIPNPVCIKFLNI